jgi:hypothetical protein
VVVVVGANVVVVVGADVVVVVGPDVVVVVVKPPKSIITLLPSQPGCKFTALIKLAVSGTVTTTYEPTDDNVTLSPSTHKV